MKEMNGIRIIGIDHGYGNMKTANCCFPTGVLESEEMPAFKQDLLILDSRFYYVGVGHKEYSPEKILDEDYYILTLAAIAQELSREHLTSASVYLAAGLPLSWLSKQRSAFREYLLRREAVDFTFRNKDYHIRIVGAEIFPQGFAAIAEKMGRFKGDTLLCDIGNGTMNLLRLHDARIDPRQMYTEMLGVHQCVLAMREDMLREHNARLDETTIHSFLQNGTVGIDPEIEATMKAAAKAYTEKLFRTLRERGYDPRLMKLYVVGGGGCLLKHFAPAATGQIFINEDICATAKGYEFMAQIQLRRERRA